MSVDVGQDPKTSIVIPAGLELEDIAKHPVQQNQPTQQTHKTLQEAIALFGQHKGIVGVMLMDRAGKIISSNFDGPITGMYCGLCKQILDAMTPTIEGATPRPSTLDIIRINSATQEVVIAPVLGENLIFVIVQEPSDQASIASATK